MDKIITHPELVKALVKEPRAIMSTLSESTTDLWHGATGVAGEGGELLAAIAMDPALIDEENVIEECGDILFYMEQIVQRVNDYHHFELNFKAAYERAQTLPISPSDLLTYAILVATNACDVLDAVKKTAIYNKALDFDRLHQAMHGVALGVTTILLAYGYSINTALEHNIKKLSVRYEGLQYSDAAAGERADKKETGETKRSFFAGDQDEA